MKTTLKSIHQISHIALAIQTVPSRAFHDHEPEMKERISHLLAQSRTASPRLTYEQFAARHPDFGRIICISLGYIVENADGDAVMRLKSYQGGEEDLLREFNRNIASFRNTFVHDEGRTFDVPFMLARMNALKIPCTSRNFATLHRPNGHPHLDLAEYHGEHGPGGRLPLSLVASVSGIATSGFDLDAQKRAEALRNGEHRLIARHGEWRVATTLNLLRILVGGYDPIPCERYYSVDVDGECGHLAAADANGSCPSVWDDRPLLLVPSEHIPPITTQLVAS